MFLFYYLKVESVHHPLSRQKAYHNITYSNNLFTLNSPSLNAQYYCSYESASVSEVLLQSHGKHHYLFTKKIHNDALSGKCWSHRRSYPALWNLLDHSAASTMQKIGYVSHSLNSNPHDSGLSAGTIRRCSPSTEDSAGNFCIVELLASTTTVNW